jgi:hypothetical protein
VPKDFKENGHPIVDLVSNVRKDYHNKEYEFMEVFKIGNYI